MVASGARTIYSWGIALTTIVGLVFLAIFAVASTTLLGGRLSDAWRTFPARLNWHWLLIVIVVMVVIATGFVLMMTLRRHRLAVGLAIAGGIRLATIMLVDAPVAHDWLFNHQMAERIAQGGHHWSNVQLGYSIVLSVPYRLFGPQPWLAEVLNLAFGLVTAWLVYRIAERMFGEPAGAAALFLFAIAADQVLMTTVLATEPLYSMLLLAAVAAYFTPRLAGAAVAGLMLGLSQYVRPTTMIILPALLGVLPLLNRWMPRMLVLVAALGIALLPVVRHNAIAYGTFSISTSQRAAWSLLVGTNPKYSGRFNFEDIGDPARHKWSAAAAAVAQAAAIKRITDNPVGFAGLATRKAWIFSAEGDYAVQFAVPNAPVAALTGLALISQAVYCATVLLATVAAWRVRRNPLAVLVLAIVATLSAAHLFLEVSPRYHAPLVPLLCVLAGAEAAHRWRDSILADRQRQSLPSLLRSDPIAADLP